MKKMSKKILFSVLVVFFGITSFVFADSANITQIVFTTSEQTIDADTLSSVITVQTQNIEGESEQVSATTHLVLSSDGSTGVFYNANTSECTTELSEPFTLTMANGSANKRFCYIDSTPGTYTITVSVDGGGWTEATQTITINDLSAGGDGDSSDDEENLTSVNFIIRNGEDLIWNGEVDLPDEGSVSISDVSENTHDVNARSVLAILAHIDEISEDFVISDLQYYDSFSSFYLRCITPAGSDELCDNWQYAVGATTPFTSIDTTELSGGETVGIYFGYPHQLVLSTTSLTTDESLIINTQSYDYENNIWNALANVSVGVTLPDPENPWSPIIVSTHEVDESGVTTITFEEENTYYLGIAEDFYFPSYTVIVSNPSSGGGGSNSNSFDIPLAVSYLKNTQNENGSFENSVLYSDWVAIAYSAYSRVSDSARTDLIYYMKSENSISRLLTDNERRAMAILSLGENPYNFDGVNYIDSILGEFDGDQFGSSSLVNDDIFAILPLSKAGYGVSDEEITKSIDFIISKQNKNGSWENSIDITAAAIQALYQFRNYGDVQNAIENASLYLEESQQSNGGFGSVYASAWVLQAMHEVGESWTKNGVTIEDYFTGLQEEDGAVLPTSDTQANRIWATAYAIPAMMGNSWGDIMQSVSRPNVSSDNSHVSNDNTITGEKKDASDDTKKVWTEEEIIGLVNKILEENPNTVIVPTNQADLDQLNDLGQEKIGEEIINDWSLGNLSASAGEANKTPTIPVIIISLSGVTLLVFLVRRFLV